MISILSVPEEVTFLLLSSMFPKKDFMLLRMGTRDYFFPASPKK